MFIFYNLVITIIFFLIVPLAFLILPLKPALFPEFMERLGCFPKALKGYLCALQKAEKRIIWVNAASVGEIMAVKPLIEELSAVYPNTGYIIITNSSSGRQMAEKLFGVGKVLLLPVDLPWIARRVVRRIKPELTVLVEFEIWPNLIYYLSKAGSKIVLINGSIQEKVLRFYARFPGLLRTTLNRIDFLGMKTAEEKRKIQNLRVNLGKIGVTGDLKYDGVKTIPEDERIILKNSLKIPEDARVFVAGSTHPGEEEILFRVYGELKKVITDLILIIAPRQIERAAEIRQLGTDYNLRPVERSKIGCSGETVANEVLILDTIGELAVLYSIASIAFVGGSMVNIGGHNLLEPVIHGKPVIFGPYIQDFQALAERLLATQIGIMVKSENELKRELLSLLQNEKLLAVIAGKAAEFLKTGRGAAENSLQIIKEFLTGFTEHQERGEKRIYGE